MSRLCSPTACMSFMTAATLLAASLLGCGADESTSSAPPKSAEPAKSGEMEKVVADVGVGAKGRSLDGYDSGIEAAMTSKAKALFAVKEDLAFNVQLKSAMSLYKATNGKSPATHEQFMQDIIKANQITLPELPPGQKYVYDPETEQLMVERPKQ